MNFRWLFIFHIALLFSACRIINKDIHDPETRPYQFEVVRYVENIYDCIDLDGDGYSEFIRVPRLNYSTEKRSYFVLQSHDLNIIDQINFAGKLANIHQFLDINEDGRLEIVAPYTRNDSLFVTFVNMEGKKLLTLFVTTGKPRIEDGGVIPWDSGISNLYLVDINGDGKKELVTVNFTGLARYPRGVMVFTFPEGRLLRKKFIGAAISDNYLGDFDNDGILELIASPKAPRNSANMGGFDDEHSYLIVFKLTPVPEIVWWKEMGG